MLASCGRIWTTRRSARTSRSRNTRKRSRPPSAKWPTGWRLRPPTRGRCRRSEDYYNLAERRYRTGIDSYLTVLDAQRQLFSVQQQLITDRLAQMTSEVNLFKALGGGWQDAVQAQPQEE